MAGPVDSQISSQISVSAGAAEPASMSLLAGQPVGPLSIGRRGTWRIVAPGVLEEHGFLYFNGTELFFQSTDPNSPLLANGAPIPGQWTAIYAPCEIAVGGARLWFGSPQGSMRPPQPPVPAPAPQAFAPRVQGNDDEESTRLHPIEELAAMRGARGPAPSAGVQPQRPPPSFGAPPPLGPTPVFPGFGVPPPAAAAPSFAQAPLAQAPPVAMPVPPVPPAVAAPPAKASWIGARWREASGPRKALFVLMVPLVWAVWAIFTDKPPAPSPPPAASAHAPPSAAPSAAAPTATEPSQPPAPSGSASARAAASAPSSSPATTGPRTPQREAADAVAAGAFDRAAKLYEDLARAHPDVPAYAEAARILKAKAGKR